MKRSLHATAAFSLVEITLAIGIAAFALIATFAMLPTGLKVQQTSSHDTVGNKILAEIIGDMRAAVRVHGSGNGNSTNFLIHLPPTSGNPWSPYNQFPSTAYFTNEGNYQSGSAGAVFQANIYYMSTNATNTTALTYIVVFWPSAQTGSTTDWTRVDWTKVAGSVATLVNINRPTP
jgi:type II secretory pathway pseudopilin PulG